MQKLLTVVIPSYNASRYLSYAVESLLPAGRCIEVIIVNDGSTDETGEIAEAYAQKHPDMIRVINKENGGHGDAIMAGLKDAKGLYFRVLDSDDRMDKEALEKYIRQIQDLSEAGSLPDLIVTNYVYEKYLEGRKKVVHYRKALPENRIIGWDDIGRFSCGSYILMHAATFRTDLIKESGIRMPRHTYYVDHLFVCYPMMYVKTIYYLDVNLYRYFIGREDQSVNDKVMVSKTDQQIRINRILLYDLDPEKSENENQKEYLYYYIELVTSATMSLLLYSNTRKGEKQWEALLREIRLKKPEAYERFMRRPFFLHPVRPVMNLPHAISYPLFRLIYCVLRYFFMFS